MFDAHLICRDGFRNVVSETGRVEGFEMKIRIPYYRGVSLSMIDNIMVKVRGETIPQDKIRFTVAAGSFMMTEMETVAHCRWNFDEAATLKIYKPGGVASQSIPVELEITIRAPYLTFSGRDQKSLTLEKDKHLKVVEG